MINATLAGFLPPFPFPWVYGQHKAFQCFYALCARSKSNRSWNSQFQPVSANERWLIKALKAVRGEQRKTPVAKIQMLGMKKIISR